MKIAFHPSAITDIRLSQNWYEQENKALGNRFSKSALKTIENLQDFPLAFPIYFASIRRVRIHGFPYHIYYQFDNSEITILAVAHTHRDPLYFKRDSKIQIGRKIAGKTP